MFHYGRKDTRGYVGVCGEGFEILHEEAMKSNESSLIHTIFRMNNECHVSFIFKPMRGEFLHELEEVEGGRMILYYANMRFIYFYAQGATSAAAAAVITRLTPV